MNLDGFFNGYEWNAYEYFGAHLEANGVRFRVYAPHAKKVTLIGSFNGWHDEVMWMQGRGGIYEIFQPKACVGDLYKFRIYHSDGSYTDKADPYGFAMELRPCSASIICNRNYEFHDQSWIAQREKGYNRPVHIYEIHFGSWKTNKGEFYTYKEMGKRLIPYLKEMGYTHVEIMPLMEHPLDESWGYQCTGFYAPTSRYGSPNDLKCFIDECHQAGIGVILDFVMVHFAVDDYGLGQFDGTPLYELPFEEVAYSEWGSYNFALGKGEVASFLKSCGNYWISEYHFDGLRIDAVANMIYWEGDSNRGVNTEAVSFVQGFNEGLQNIHGSIILIAEDSTNYLKVTAPVAYGGLGFDYKWDLGFMHDTLHFFEKSSEERKWHYRDLLFSMHYFYNELYMLAFSHDENVHGKKTILDRMYGNYEEKFANARLLYSYMLTHPGKKLNFMGNEIGQFREWAQYREQDFEVLSQFEMHEKFQRFFRDLNRIYANHKALNEGEYNPSCFQFVIDDRQWDGIYSYLRKAGGETILVVLNVSEDNYKNYGVPIKGNHRLQELMNTDAVIYGGDNDTQNVWIDVRNGWCQMDMAPYSARIFTVE